MSREPLSKTLRQPAPLHVAPDHHMHRLPFTQQHPIGHPHDTIAKPITAPRALSSSVSISNSSSYRAGARYRAVASTTAIVFGGCLFSVAFDWYRANLRRSY